MKTLSFRNLRIGRSEDQELLKIDTQSEGVEFKSGIHLIVAPNGMGKSTFFQTLGGWLAPLAGEAWVDGKNAVGGSEVQFISEYLTFPKYIFPKEWVSYLSGQDNPNAYEKWIDALNMTEQMKRYMGQLSQGERRKVTWMASEESKASVVLMDEPFDGLDIFAVDTVRKMLLKWKERNRVVLLTSHQPADVSDLCDSVMMIHQKKLTQLQVQKGEKDLREKIISFYK